MKKQIILSSLKNYFDCEGLDPNSVVERKTLIPTLTISPEEESTCVANISTQDVDADGDLVYANGVRLERYVKNPVICWSHDYSKPPIGKMTEMKVGDHHVEGKIKFAPTEVGQEMFKLVKGGFLKTCSIGFITHKALVRGTKEYKDFCVAKGIQVSDACKRIISDWTMIENSMVCIPSNQDALVHAVSAKSFLKDLGLENKGVENPASTESAPTVITLPMDDHEAVQLNMEHNDSVVLLSMEDLHKMTDAHDPVEEATKPYPNEHSARIHEPGKYQRFRRHNDAFGPGVDAIYGITSDGRAEVQAIRFDASKFDVQQVHAWLTEHHYSPISVHPAAPKSLMPETRETNVAVSTPEAIYSEGVPKERIDEGTSGDNGAAAKYVIISVSKPAYEVVRKGCLTLDDVKVKAIAEEVDRELKLVAAGRIV